MNDLPAKKNQRVLVIDDNPAIHNDFEPIVLIELAVKALIHLLHRQASTGIKSSA